MQTADSRPGTKCRLGIKCRLQTGYQMQTENLYCFFVWYVITCHLATYRASRNCFSAIVFHDYLHYCGKFLARFLITVVLNIISSLHIVFSLCARVGWCDVCTEFTNLIKVDVGINEMSQMKQLIALHVVHTFHVFNRYEFKNADRDQNCSLDLIYFQHWFSHMWTSIVIGLHKEPGNFL